MPYVLRELTRDHKDIWDKDKVYEAYKDWLSNSEIPAECLIDLGAKGNELSLWQVQNTDDPNINRLSAGITVRKNEIRHFEYVLFDIQAIENIEDFPIRLLETPGLISIAELKNLHRDVNYLTVDKLVKLVEAVWPTTITGLVLGNTIEDAIRDEVASGKLNPKDINGNIRKKLNL